MPPNGGDTPEEAVRLAAAAIDSISNSFSADPSEETMRRAYELNCTRNEAANEIIRNYVESTLAFWKARQGLG